MLLASLSKREGLPPKKIMVPQVISEGLKLQPGLYASTWYITASKLNSSASQLLESMFTQELEE
jgi:hypothetical protein